jgi:hypothetical protein
VALWQSGDDVRALAALQHEGAHALQDLTTGVGHHDYLETELVLPQLFSFARERTKRTSILDESKWKWCHELLEGRLWLTTTEEKLRVRRAERKEAFRRLLGNHGVSDLDPRPFDLVSVLETAAAASVMSQLFTLARSAEQAAALESEKGALDPWLMGPTYSELMTLALSVAREVCKSLGDDPGSSTPSGTSLAVSVARVLIELLGDIALAVPPPDAESHANPNLLGCDPGLKLARLLRAVQYVVASDALHKVFSDAFKERLWPNVEALLLDVIAGEDHCAVYPHSKDVYTQWHRHLVGRQAELAMAKRKDPILEARIEACERRTKGELAFWELDAVGLTYLGVPLALTLSDGRLMLLGSESHSLLLWIADRNHAVSLAEHMLRGTRLECLLARSLCGASTAICRVGIDDIAELPSNGCSVRDFVTAHRLIHDHRA